MAALVRAAAPKGAIDRVEFCVGDKVLFVAHQEPFEYTFIDLAPGVHTLAARAVESSGKSSRAEVTIRVGARSK